MSKTALIPNRPKSLPNWTNMQAYILAVFCLTLGVALGYLFRGSESPAVSVAADSQSAMNKAPAGMPPGHVSAEQQKAMFDKAAAPLLETLKGDPNNFQTVVKVGNLYYDGKQYEKAVDYYKRALQIDPNNADVRTDLGTSYWYLGNADEAIKEFQKSLKIRPDHAGTLFNMGIVKWQGKMDPAGAVAAWQELLKRNPDYPQKQQIEDFIAKAKQHAKA